MKKFLTTQQTIELAQCEPIMKNYQVGTKAFGMPVREELQYYVLRRISG